MVGRGWNAISSGAFEGEPGPLPKVVVHALAGSRFGGVGTSMPIRIACPDDRHVEARLGLRGPPRRLMRGCGWDGLSAFKDLSHANGSSRRGRQGCRRIRSRLEARPGPWKAQKVTVLLDCTHNAEAVETLCASLGSLTANRTVLVLGVMEDKPYERMLELLAPLADRRILTTPGVSLAGRRAIAPQVLAGCCSGVAVANHRLRWSGTMGSRPRAIPFS